MEEKEKVTENITPSNFIYDYIDEDLKEGVYSHIQTRFRLSLTVICI